MKRKLATIILIALMLMAASECGGCDNCNPEGTPYPTLSPVEYPEW